MIHHCAAYNRLSIQPCSVDPGQLYRPPFPDQSGVCTRSPSIYWLTEQMNRQAKEEEEYIVSGINSVVTDIAGIDWTFWVATRIKADGENLSKCQLNIRAAGGNLMHSSFSEQPSVTENKLEMESTAERCRAAGSPIVGLVIDDEKFAQKLYEIYREADPANNGLGCRLGFFHCMQRCQRTLTPHHIGVPYFLADLSDAIKFRSAEHQAIYVQQVQHRKRQPISYPELMSKSRSWWNKNTAVPRFYRSRLEQHKRVWAAYQKFENYTDAEGIHLLADGPGGTKAAIMKLLVLILDGWLQHFPGKPTHLNRAAPGKIADYITYDSESGIEAFHMQERRVLKDSGKYGPEHGGNKLLRCELSA